MCFHIQNMKVGREKILPFQTVQRLTYVVMLAGGGK